MPDYEPQQRYDQPETGAEFKVIKNILGVMLIVAGGLMAVWICMSVYKMFTNPHELSVFLQIVPTDAGTKELQIDGKTIVLPPALFAFLAYAVGILLLMVGCAAATGLLSGGANLLDVNSRKFEQTMTRKMQSIRDKVDEVKDTIDRNLP